MPINNGTPIMVTMKTYWKNDGNIVCKLGARSIAKKYVTVSVLIAAKIKAKYIDQPFLK